MKAPWRPVSARFRRRLIRLLVTPFLLLLLLIGVALILLSTQQRRLVQLGVDQVNKELPGGHVEVGGSQLALFQNFPYISIALTDVRLYAGKADTSKPICAAERVFVGFSLFDILRRHYKVKALAVKNGRIDLVQDAQGRLNLLEATRMAGDSSAPASPDSTGSAYFNVKKFVLKNMDVTWLDQPSQQRLAVHIDRIQTAFRLKGRQVSAGISGAWVLDYTRPGDTALFRHKHLRTDLELNYDLRAGTLDIQEGSLNVEDAEFRLSGMADLRQDSVNLHVSGAKPDFNQLIAFAPERAVGELKHFRYDGSLAFDGTIVGKIQSGTLPLINLDFSCAHAWVHNTEAGRNLDSVSFRGFYTNGPDHSLRTSELRLMDMTARPDRGVFTGNFIMRDFTDPKVLMQVNSDLELGFIGAFFGIPDLEHLSGHINLRMDFRELVDISVPQQSLSRLTQGIQSELTVTNLGFRIPGYPDTIAHLNLHAAMKNGFVTLDSLSCRVGHSDFYMDGSLSDLPALFHKRDQPVTLQCRLHSSRMILRELLNADTTRVRFARENIYGFNVGLSLVTSVNELLHPNPLPRGRFRMDSLYASFSRYPHAFRDFGADLTINDTALLLRNFGGNIDSSDIRFNGRVVNYALWFDKVKKGRTQLAFDLKSRRLAVRDILGRHASLLVPPDYRRETASNVWLRSKIDLRYDSVFQFANVKIAHISGALLNHDFRLDSIRGNVKFGIDEFIKIDTLRGRVGNSDFDLSMRVYNGKDTLRRRKENYLRFASRYLDLDQLGNYRLADTTGPPDTSHNVAFNIFSIPFIDFNGSVDIGKIEYKDLWPRNISSRLHMQANQQLYLDTLRMDIAGGTITAHAHFNGSDPEKIYLRSRVALRDVNLQKLLFKLDYLGQDYYINKNIKGTVDGVIRSYVQLHPDMTPVVAQSQARIEVEVRNGELVNFAPMQAMSAYFRDKNLSVIRFDTLRDTLSFKDGALYIPSMNINSSIGYMEIAGKQSLDMQMEYDLRIPLKLVTEAGFSKLFGKKKEEVNPDQVDAIQYLDKDKRVHFINLKVTGTPDDYKVKLGKARIKAGT